MPLFVFECMAAGIPLVATAVGGLPEIVQDGTTGLLVPPRDPAALAGALTTILTDRSLSERMAAAAAVRLHEYEIDAVAARFADLYEQLTAEARTT
jgi:glycosyltransferase involved in cell wall biosynthesis